MRITDSIARCRMFAVSNDIQMSLNDFAIKQCHTQIRIIEARIKTLNEIVALNECEVIDDREFIRLGKELWMNS